MDVVDKRFGELTTGELYEILRLRCEVFVVEQACAYADIDGRDREPATGHHWIEIDDRLVAYARTLADADGSTRIGRVVTDPAHRGAGHAATLIGHLTRSAAGPVTLHAQSHLTGWYERFGYAVDGPEYVEDGIPHVPMRLVR